MDAFPDSRFKPLVRGGQLAFQVRPPLIERGSFSGALQALLNKSGGYRWRVNIARADLPWEDWLESVARVT